MIIAGAKMRHMAARASAEAAIKARRPVSPSQGINGHRWCGRRRRHRPLGRRCRRAAGSGEVEPSPAAAARRSEGHVTSAGGNTSTKQGRYLNLRCVLAGSAGVITQAVAVPRYAAGVRPERCNQNIHELQRPRSDSS